MSLPLSHEPHPQFHYIPFLLLMKITITSTMVVATMAMRTTKTEGKEKLSSHHNEWFVVSMYIPVATIVVPDNLSGVLVMVGLVGVGEVRSVEVVNEV